MTQTRDIVTGLLKTVECDSCGHSQNQFTNNTVSTKEIVNGSRSSIVFLYDQCMECWLDGKPLSKKGRLKKRAEIMARKKDALP